MQALTTGEHKSNSEHLAQVPGTRRGRKDTNVGTSQQFCAEIERSVERDTTD